MAIAGYKCLVKVSSAPLSLVDEPTTASADFKTYQITDPAKRVLHPTEAITVAVNATAVTSGYTLDRLSGKVIFDTALLDTDVVTVSGLYLPLATAAEAYELSYTISATNSDRTRFQDAWTRRLQNQLDASGSFQQWYLTGSDMAEELMSGNPIVVEYQIDGQIDLRAWALLSSTEPAAQAKEIQTENIQWEGTSDIDGRVISNGN